MQSTLSSRRLVGCWLLAVVTLLCFTSAHSLFIRTFNDSNCTQPLPQYSYSAPSLNYSNDFGASPLTYVCGPLPNTAGLSANYSCGVTQPSTGIAYLRMYVVNSSDCSVSLQSLQLYFQSNGPVSATQSTCLPIAVGDATSSLRVRGFGYWSCAVQPASNAAHATRSAAGGVVALALSMVAASVALVTVLIA